MLQLETIETYYKCTWCALTISPRKHTDAWVDVEKDEAFHTQCKDKWEEREKQRQIFYTTCCDRYDGFGTLDLGIVGTTERGKDVRKVAIEKDHVQWQTMRYSSGLGGAWTQKDYDEQVTYGWITPTKGEE